MLRIIFSLVFGSVASFATSYAGFGDRLPIYTIGDASPMADALNFVAMLADSTAIQGILLAGLIISTMRLAGNIAKRDPKGTILEVIYSIFILIFFLLPTSNVSVVDARVAHGGAAAPDVSSSSEVGYISYKTVDNIPLGLAAIASFSTVVNWDLASLVDTVIAPVGGVDNKYLGVTQAGISTPANDLRWIVKNIANGVGKGKNPTDYEYMFHEYVRVCAFPTVSLDMRNAQRILKPVDGNYMESLSPDNLIGVAGTTIFDPISKTNIDCKDYWNNNLASASIAFEDNILEQFRNYKKYDANGANTDYETGLRNLINGTTSAGIAGFKDSISALKRASIVASAVDAASTGVTGIDMSNRMSMTSAKQSIMTQGAAQFAWLGEVLPLGINIGFAFLIITGFLMSMFLLFQGWEKGLKIILNFIAGFFALGFSYVSLAITQGVVNRRAWADAVEQYVSQGSPLQVTNYDFILEQAATMDGLTGILGLIFVSAGSAIVFYGESKYIVGGIMNKVASSYGGNNLEQTQEDNAKDTALAESLMEKERQRKMAGRLAEAGIAFDGGNIEFEYQRLQNELAAIGSARGAHDAISGGPGASSSDAMSARSNTIAGSEAQSFEKSVQLQGYGAEVQSGGMDNSLKRIQSGAFAKGRGGAAAAMREGDMLSTKSKEDQYVEGAARSAEVKVAQTIGAGKAKPEGGMKGYLDDIEKEATVGFLSKGVKAAAAANHGLKEGSDRELDKDYAEGMYRGEASNMESTKMKSRINNSREDYIKNSAANAYKHEAESQSSGRQIRDRFGDEFLGLASSIPYAGKKVSPDVKVPSTEDLVVDIAKGKNLKATIAKVEGDKIKTPAEKEVEEMLKNTSDQSKSLPESVFTQSKTKPEEKSSRSDVKPQERGNDIGLPFFKEATPAEKSLMAETGLSLEDVRRNKNSIVGHESSGSTNHRLREENRLGYIGMAQFGAAALADVGLVDKDKYLAATHKTKHGRAWNRGVDQKSFLADDDNWTIPGGKRAFMGSFSMQDDALTKLMTANAKTLKRAGVDLGDSSHTKGLLMASHLGGAGNAINFAKRGIGFRDANGTSIGSYYNAGANDITKGYGGTVNSSGGGVRNTNTGSMSLKEIAAAHARKGLDEWIATGQSIANTYQQDPSAYATAAAFREAGALMTSQSIEGKGGLKSAINQGMMTAASEGSAEKAAFVGKTTQQLVSQGMNPNDAKKMAESIASGSERGAEKFKQAIMAASASAAITNAAEQEGMSQMHSKNLQDEFGETLTEKTSKASGKTFTQEQEAVSDDVQEQKQRQWEQRKEALQKKRDQMALYTKGDNTVAAAHVQSVLNNVVEADPSLNNTGRAMAKQEISSLSKRIQNGEEVTTKDIKKALGSSLGDKAIEALETNGVVFQDADGIGTGDAIDAKTTGGRIKQHMANAVIVGALQEQDKTNQQLLNSGDISQQEYEERREKLGYLMKSASGGNGGSMPFEYFKDAGFTQETLDKFGIKEGNTERANMVDRMFQISHIDSNSVLGAAVKSFDEEINKEMPKESRTVKPTKSPEVKNESKEHSWNELADAQEDKRVKEFIGSGTGIIENTAKNDAMYSENAMYGEMSRAATTQAKIEAQGGIHKAAAVDSAESTIKAATQKGAVSEQAAQLAGGGEDGKKIAEAIKNGSAEGADLLAAGIVRAAQELGAAQSGARTASDMSQIREIGGKEAFIEAASVEGAKRGVTSKVQNIDVGSEEVANKQVQGILSTTKTEDRQKVLDSLKNFGMVTEDSTLEHVQATSGAQFIKGKAAASAATMSKDDRLSIAGYTYSLSTDSTTGDTRVEATNAQGLTTGRYVHDKTGVKVDNPIQMMTKEATGYDTTDAYTGRDTDGDGSADGIGSVLGGAAIGVAGAIVASSAYKSIDWATGNNLSKIKNAAKHKLRGHVAGMDSEGNKVYFDNDTWNNLKENGMAEQDKDGKWKVTADKKKVESYLSSTHPSSAGSFQTSQANLNTNPINAPTKNAVIDNSLLSELSKGSDSSLPNGNNDYTTKEGLSQVKDTLSSSQSGDIGRISLKNTAKQTANDAKIELQEATLAGDDAGVKKASAKLGAANKILSDLDDGLDVDMKDVKKAGISMPHTKTKQVSPNFSKEVVNFDSLGEEVKAVEGAKIDRVLQGAEVVEHTPHTGDVPVPKTRAGKVMAWALGLAGGATLFSSQADAKEMPSRAVMPEDGTATAPISAADTAGLVMQGAFNGVNAVGAAMEMRSGASTNVADLFKGSSYKDGFKTIAKDAVDVSDFKGLATTFADDGVVEGAKMSGKALGKSAMKKLPFVGVAAGAAFAMDRAEHGDFIGAALEFASGAVSMIPGIGTAASVAIDAALMKRDYDAANQGSATPSEQIQAMNRYLQPMSNQEAGVSYIESVTPSDNRPAVTKAAQSGTLTKEQMLKSGTPTDIVERIPVNENGTVDVETSGSLYKEGMAQMEAVTQMPNHPTFKYSGNLGNSVIGGNISSVAASSILPQQDIEQQSVQVQTDAQPQQSPVQTMVQTIVQERVVESAGGTDSITLQSGGANEVTEFAKNATSPGNVQTSSSDLKKSIDEVGLAMENMRASSGNIAPEQVALNSFALGDLASGMAVATPLQTAGGELTIGSRDGYMTLGEGANAIRTPISSDFIKSAPPEAIDRLASTFSNSRINNEMIKTISDEDVYGGMAGMASTNEMMYEMNTLARTGSVDTRLQNEDQVSLLEELVSGIEKMSVAVMPEDEKAV